MARKIEETEEEEQIVLTGVEKEKATDTAKCPSCGANMTFDPEKQLLKCDHCGSEKSFESSKNEELQFEELFKVTEKWSDETHVYTCANCGAKEVVSNKEIAKNCSFCGTSNIVKTDELSGMKPNALVPFKITLADAAARAVAWAKKRFFAPRRFKKSVRTDEIKGAYNPAFTFDAATLSSYSGRLGKYHYKTVRVNGRTETRREIRYFSISGIYNFDFDDILIQASTVIKQKTIDKLQPFDTNDSKKYAEEFLFGYTANQYTKDGKECWGEARKVMDRRIRAGILAKYAYDVVDYLNVSTRCENVTYKYLLLPLYIGHFNYGKKLFNYFVNGFNGKVTGRMPVSPLKVLGVVALGLAAIAGIALLVIYVL
ncbi:MAG: hypothetical protein LBP26_00785 [Clostridiales bacterium]|jgi:DNA-directed RNA polymerase subunit RPC12/RpoP|nr:hypothetical protein [Clostridiales bacterium]